MSDKHVQWVARLTLMPGTSMETLLHMPFGLDVWERHPDRLVVMATDSQLAEIERRGFARVERLATAAEFQTRAHRNTDS
jgi:hypothetical protein